MVLVGRLRMPWFGINGGVAKTRAPSFRLIVDFASLSGPPNFWSSTWCTLDLLPMLLLKMLLLGPIVLTSFLFFPSFLASLHWPQEVSDLGKFGISYFELLLMFEVFSGSRLQD